MALEDIAGTLLAYKQLEQGTLQHADQITDERRTNHDLRGRWFYTADGALYTVQRRKPVWAITREPQNVVLKNIDEAYRQLTGPGNYFPDAQEATSSLEHPDTVVVDVEGLHLVKDSEEYGHFTVDPKRVKRLTSQQRLAAQRVYGPDEGKFGKNMEMFAESGKVPFVLVLMPSYVQQVLQDKDKEYVGRASWLGVFGLGSDFGADVRNVSNLSALRGVRELESAAGAAPKIEMYSPEHIARALEKLKLSGLEAAILNELNQ